jgi:hypothetical protein
MTAEVDDDYGCMLNTFCSFSWQRLRILCIMMEKKRKHAKAFKHAQEYMRKEQRSCEKDDTRKLHNNQNKNKLVIVSLLYARINFYSLLL